jgi:hypothetical protein
VMVDNTEEFIEREQPNRRISIMPPPAEVEFVNDVPHEPPPQLAALTRLLSGLDAPLSVADGVVGGGFSAASYRLSLLSLLGEQNVDPELAQLAYLPISLHWEDGHQMSVIGRDEVAAISAGTLTPIQEENP